MQQNRHYEVLLIAHPNQRDQIDLTMDKYKNVITEKGGHIHRYENWGRIQLAYTIDNLNKAIYILLNIECSQEVLDELNHLFYYNDLIIRTLVLNKSKAITAPSVMVDSDSDSEDNEA